MSWGSGPSRGATVDVERRSTLAHHNGTPVVVGAELPSVAKLGYPNCYRDQRGYIRRNLRSGITGGNRASTFSPLVGVGFASISFFCSIRFKRLSSNVAKSCSLAAYVTASLGISNGSAAIAALILTGSG